jgi:hypothetical protein
MEMPIAIAAPDLSLRPSRLISERTMTQRPKYRRRTPAGFPDEESKQRHGDACSGPVPRDRRGRSARRPWRTEVGGYKVKTSLVLRLPLRNVRGGIFDQSRDLLWV